MSAIATSRAAILYRQRIWPFRLDMQARRPYGRLQAFVIDDASLFIGLLSMMSDMIEAICIRIKVTGSHARFQKLAPDAERHYGYAIFARLQ